jgi:glycosyltransferase involved in cell wall biosynthesis
LGHEVTVLTRSEYREHVREEGPKHNIDFRFIDLPQAPLGTISTQLGNAQRYLRWQNAALEHARAESARYDVIHHVSWSGLHLGSQLWRLPTPLVYGPIGGGQTAPASYWRYFGSDLPMETLRTLATGPSLQLNRICRNTIRNARVILVGNLATATAVARLGARDIRSMLSDGMSQSWCGAAHSQPAGTPIVLFMGRLISRKSPTLAVEAFAELRKRMPARMLIAGDGPLRDKVRATINRLGVSGDVEMLGHVPHEEIRQLYDSSSVLLFTSLRESFGAPFLEAFGRGIPAVTLDLHGIGDAEVGAAAVKVPLAAHPHELPGHLGQALAEVLTDNEWESRSAAGIKFASNCLWSVKAAEATKIYEEIAS